MKIRAKANGNILDMSAEEAQPLIDCGVYEAVEDMSAATPADDEVKPKGRKYQRRDLTAEE